MAEPTEADVDGVVRVLQTIDRQVQLAKRGQATRLTLDARKLAEHVADAHAEEREAVEDGGRLTCDLLGYLEDGRCATCDKAPGELMVEVRSACDRVEALMGDG